jgi:type I restriction enzyme M protein
MANVGAVISSIRNIMRQDRGISGDAQRLEQLGWMLFLKIIDDKDQELEIIKDNYVSVIPEKFQWRNWASNPEGITGDELINFIDSNEVTNKGLFLSLRELKSTTNPKRAMIVKEVFDGTNNYMKSGYEMRKVINKLNEIDFTKSEDKHVFGNIYESILQELRDAGNKGEYYTPRAVTQLMTMMTNPKLGEKVLDPAAGTGGFLTAAIDHVRDNYVKTVDDEAILQTSITGWELKPVAYVLGLTNLILHEIDVPDYHYIDSLKKEYNSIGKKDQVDVILANPPFGASIADGVETNFPSTYRCKESADLFLILILKLLKSNGRCAIVMPDSCITGEGVKARIREKLLTEANLHTIIRLPDSTFHPATVPTNLLFFEAGSSTKDIWYFEHNLPLNQKSYSKTKPIQFKEFEPLIKWWNKRTANESAWKVNVKDLVDWDLDIKNPTRIKDDLGNSKQHYSNYITSSENYNSILDEISKALALAEHLILGNVLLSHSYLFRNEKFIEILKELILKEAFNGKLSDNWRKLNMNENALELIDNINAHKNELINNGVIKKVKTQSKNNRETNLFNIPENWIWTTLGDIVQHNAGKTLHKGKNTGVLKDYITTSNLYWGHFQLESVKKISIEPKEFSRCTATKGDLLICEGGDVGRSAIWNYDYDICFQNHIHRVRPYCDMNAEYIYYYMMYLHKSNLIKGYKKGMGIGNLSGTALASIKIPIPPVKEQEVIVEIVKKLMGNCTSLMNEIGIGENYAQMLMKAVLNEAFETNMQICQD